MHSSPPFPHVQKAQETEKAGVQPDFSGAWFLFYGFVVILMALWIATMIGKANLQQKKIEFQNGIIDDGSDRMLPSGGATSYKKKG